MIPLTYILFVKKTDLIKNHISNLTRFMSAYILKDENRNQPENFILKCRYATFHLQSIVIPFFSLDDLN